MYGSTEKNGRMQTQAVTHYHSGIIGTRAHDFIKEDFPAVEEYSNDTIE